ncbi:SPOR domain-containing protein [Pseudogemmobacter faecipullorum]|uniref:SPOR domain-containing protein n=1 Tax=Pseudogemmobacter faecipullorum TaxID=2755041 RepID=A0ABS8CGJ7_9RHOB|nr:SPOR domain-containing protein [Pseudogemmobacter faecipullorum]MCB5408499.1 SPOR domain-containing protein [Pseudogemmobacter faecipullorum]
MSGKVLSATVLAAVLAVSPARADLRGPAELPPASYKGQQYVDSRGCVFLRAGYGGRETWVPRVSRDRKQLCGYPASGKAVETAEAAAPAPVPAAPPPVPPAVKAPAAAVAAAAPAVKPAAPAKVAKAPPATPLVTASASAPLQADGMRLACPASAPVPQRIEMQGGGSSLLCTRGDGSLEGVSFPQLAGGSLAGRPIGYDALTLASGRAASSFSAPKTATAPHARAAGDFIPEPPPGYKLAWSDDRLNPNRARGTAQGVIDQDEIWTRHTPAELREDQNTPRPPLKVVVRRSDGSVEERSGVILSTRADGKKLVRLLPAENVRKSTRGDAGAALAAHPPAKAAAVAATGARHFIQVGSFGVPANAAGTEGRLRGAGLPVARNVQRGLQVVFAGPFASADEARMALAQVRALGFGDAILR